MNLQKYLDRFNATNEKLSLNSLSELQKLHLQHVPFENLDVIRRVPIYLNLETIFEKIVLYHRGGYCYELNGLFHALLTKLGYQTHLVSATILRPNGEWAKADTHAALLVYFDQPYLVDVGFGAATPRRPVPFQGEMRTDVGEIYKIQQHSETMYDLIRKTNEEERTLYRFNSSEKNLVDFHEGCVFNQVSTNSTFTHVDIASIFTPSGRITLRDQTLTEVNDGVIHKQELSADDKAIALKNIFNLCLKNV